MGERVNIIFTSLTAYALSRKGLMFGNAITIFIVFKMFLSGGLTPTYLLVNTLKLTNTYDFRWWNICRPGSNRRIDKIFSNSCFNLANSVGLSIPAKVFCYLKIKIYNKEDLFYAENKQNCGFVHCGGSMCRDIDRPQKQNWGNELSGNSKPQRNLSL